jgi:hypothetical protein
MYFMIRPQTGTVKRKFQKVPYPSGILPHDCEYSERMLKECWKKMLKEAAFTAGMLCFHGRKMVN